MLRIRSRVCIVCVVTVVQFVTTASAQDWTEILREMDSTRSNGEVAFKMAHGKFIADTVFSDTRLPSEFHALLVGLQQGEFPRLDKDVISEQFSRYLAKCRTLNLNRNLGSRERETLAKVLVEDLQFQLDVTLSAGQIRRCREIALQLYIEEHGILAALSQPSIQDWLGIDRSQFERLVAVGRDQEELVRRQSKKAIEEYYSAVCSTVPGKWVNRIRPLLKRTERDSVVDVDFAIFKANRLLNGANLKSEQPEDLSYPASDVSLRSGFGGEMRVVVVKGINTRPFGARYLEFVHSVSDAGDIDLSSKDELTLGKVFERYLKARQTIHIDLPSLTNAIGGVAASEAIQNRMDQYDKELAGALSQDGQSLIAQSVASARVRRLGLPYIAILEIERDNELVIDRDKYLSGVEKALKKLIEKRQHINDKIEFEIISELRKSQRDELVKTMGVKADWIQFWLGKRYEQLRRTVESSHVID